VDQKRIGVSLNRRVKMELAKTLMPNDAMIASTCLKHEISKIATFDSDFLRVDWLSVINQSE
jgi:hypothetical protein